MTMLYNVFIVVLVVRKFSFVRRTQRIIIKIYPLKGYTLLASIVFIMSLLFIYLRRNNVEKERQREMNKKLEYIQ